MKKGFSLIELMVVIVLLGVIITIASISVTSIKKNSDKNLCDQKEKYIITSAVKYGQEHLNDINNTSDSHYKNCSDSKKGYVITVQDLINGGYIIADNGDKDRLLVPGKPDDLENSFNPSTICIRYENVYNNKNLDDYSSSYHGGVKYQVTAKMNNSKCGSY